MFKKCCLVVKWGDNQLLQLPIKLPENVNTLRPRQDGRHFPDDIFKCIFLNENMWISIKISLKFLPKSPITNITALVQIMAWCRPGDKPLSEPLMVSLMTHICVTRPEWILTHDSFSLDLFRVVQQGSLIITLMEHHVRYYLLKYVSSPRINHLNFKSCLTRAPSSGIKYKYALIFLSLECLFTVHPYS